MTHRNEVFGPVQAARSRYDRRQFLLLGGAAAFAGLAGGCGGSSSEPAASKSTGKSTSLVVADFGGELHTAWETGYYKPFEAKTGIAVKSVAYDSSIGAIKAQVRGAKQWDVIGLGNAIPEKLAKELLAPIDYGIVKQPGVPKELQLPYYVGEETFAYVMAHRTDKLKTGPTTWPEFWDVGKFPGTRAMFNYPVGTLEMALLGDGLSYDELYPLDVERALKSIDALSKRTKVVFFNTGAEQLQFLRSGIADLAQGWDGRLLAAADDGLKVAFPVDGALLQVSYLAVLKTSRNVEAAMQFIDLALSPKANASIATGLTGSMPTNQQAFGEVPAKLKEKSPSNPAYANRIAGYVDAAYWAGNFDAVYKRWQEWYSAR